MVQAVRDLIDFTYLVRRNVIDEDALLEIDAALQHFHVNREAFRPVRPSGFSLPRQHSLVHYHFLITEFGAPNGLCSSITESKHIKAVKKPYRRTSRNKPLGQMLVINQRIDKLAAARVDFKERGMLEGSILPFHLLPDGDLPPHAPHPQLPPLPVPYDDEGEEFGIVDEPESLSEIRLAKTYGTSWAYIGEAPADLLV